MEENCHKLSLLISDETGYLSCDIEWKANARFHSVENKSQNINIFMNINSDDP